MTDQEKTMSCGRGADRVQERAADHLTPSLGRFPSDTRGSPGLRQPRVEDSQAIDCEPSERISPAAESSEAVSTSSTLAASVPPVALQHKPEQQGLLANGDTRLQGRPVRTPKENAGGAIRSVVTGLLPTYFLVFAGMAHMNDATDITEGSQAAWLLDAAAYGPTVFPVLFVAIVGQFLTVIASWRLERGISIGTLEYLLSSRSLGSAFLSLFKLWMFSVWTPIIVTTWCLSPLGGQAALRAVAQVDDRHNVSQPIYYLDYNRRSPFNPSSNESQTMGAVIDTAFTAALASSGTDAQDMYGNIHTPIMEGQLHTVDRGQWINVTKKQSAIHTALLGLPFMGVSTRGNSSFVIQTPYLWLDCEVLLTNTTTDDQFAPYLAQAYPGLDLRGAANYSRRTGAILHDFTPDHMWNESEPRIIGLESETLSQDSLVYKTSSFCNLTMSYVEARVRCTRGPHKCKVVAMRKAVSPPCPETATGLDGLGTFDCQRGLAANVTQAPGRDFLARMMNAVPPSDNDHYTVLEQYFITPETPYVFPDSTIPIGSIGRELFAQRFTQLLNTYWLAYIAPYAITRSVSYNARAASAQEEAPWVMPSEFQDRNYGVRNTTASVSIPRTVIRYDRLWLSILTLLSFALICVGCITALLELHRRGPVMIDDFVSSLRHNPHAVLQDEKAGRVVWTDDGSELASRFRYFKVQLGDVRPDEDLGHVTIATLGKGVDLRPIRTDRLYA